MRADTCRSCAIRENCFDNHWPTCNLVQAMARHHGQELTELAYESWEYWYDFFDGVAPDKV